MKKHSFSILLAFILVFTLTPNVFATNYIELDSNHTTEYIYLDNGSYITITIITQDVSALSLESATSASVTKTGSKIVTCNDKNGNLEWKYTLFAEYSVVEGVSATCTSATYTPTIYDSAWSFSNGNVTKSGNAAYGVGTFKEKFLLVTIDTVNIDISLSCDAYGNIS